MRRIFLPLVFCLLGAAASATEISGTVRSVSGAVATVVTEGEMLPAAGDKAEIFFKLAGTDDEISVATGSVATAEGDAVQVKIENATGDVAAGQSVRITSEKSRKRAGAAPQGASAPASILGRWKEERDAGWKLTFKGDGRVVIPAPDSSGVTLTATYKLDSSTKPARLEIANFELVPPPQASDEEAARFREEAQKQMSEDEEAAKFFRTTWLGRFDGKEIRIDSFRRKDGSTSEDKQLILHRVTAGEGPLVQGKGSSPAPPSSRAQSNASFAFVDMNKLAQEHPEKKGELAAAVQRQSAGITMVWDSTGSTLNGIPFVVIWPAEADATPAVTAGLSNANAPPASGMRNLKIGLVDMNRIFKNFGKTVAAEKQINAAKDKAKKEYDRRAAPYLKLHGSVSAMPEGTERSNGIAKLRDLEKSINEFRDTKEKELQDEAAKLREGLVQDMMAGIRASVGTERAALLLDSGGLGLQGGTVLLWQSGVPDLSDTVLETLNKRGRGKLGVALASSSSLHFAGVNLDRAMQATPSGQQALQEIAARKAEVDQADAAARPAKQREFDDWSRTKRSAVMATMAPRLREVAERGGYQLVFDSSGQSLNGMPFLLRADLPDLTDELIAALK